MHSATPLWAAPGLPWGSGRRAVLACLGAALLGLLTAMVVAWGLPARYTVHLSFDGRTVTYTSSHRTVGEVLAGAGVVVRPGDRVVPSPSTEVWPGMDISVIREVPITLSVGGRLRHVRVAARTVREALSKSGVVLGPLDRVYPSLAAPLAPHMRVTVERREWRRWVEHAPVPFGVREVPDSQLLRGHQAVRFPGREGVKARTLRVLYADGHPVSVLASPWTVIRPPAPRVVAIGTRAMVASRGPFVGREYLLLEATAYYPGPHNFGGGVGPRTAIGLVAQRGVVAVDPSIIPLGSRLYVEGYGYAIAGDTGSAIQGMRIDLCYNTYEEAIRFGRRLVKVYILSRR